MAAAIWSAICRHSLNHREQSRKKDEVRDRRTLTRGPNVRKSCALICCETGPFRWMSRYGTARGWLLRDVQLAAGVVDRVGQR